MKEGYALCLNKWALDKSINGELGLLLIISSLCAEKGYCYASNEYLAEIFNEHTTTISRKIKKLKELGYITIEYEKRGAEIKKRFLRLANLLTDDYQNCYSTISKVAKENNISINNTSINKKEIYKERFVKPTIEEIEEYCKERNNGIDAVMFYNFYESKDWMIGKNKIKNWKSCIITWERNRKQNVKQDIELPSWYDKEIETQTLSQEEQNEMEKLLEDFK